MSLCIITAHAGASCMPRAVKSWNYEPTVIVDGSKGMLEAYEKGWRENKADWYMFAHDDVLIHEEGWWNRINMQPLGHSPEADAIGLTGFGGAIRHGHPDLGKLPYDFRQLGRYGYLSNTKDAETHGQRASKAQEVAVLDGFCLIVRREILEKAGGWPLGTPIGYSLYDYWLSAETHRQGYRIWMVPIACEHLGGQTAVKLGKAQGWGKQHEEAHRWMYENYRDVLPWSCE